MEQVLKRVTAQNGGNLNIDDLEELAHNPEAFRGHANKVLAYFSGKQSNFSNQSQPMNEAFQTLGSIVSAPFLTEDNKIKGIASYVTSKKGKNKFSIQLVNGGSADIEVSLFAGSARGTSLAANSILDTITNLTVTSKTPNKIFAHLAAAINAKPSLLENILIQSTDPNQVVEKFTVKRLFSFSDDTTKQIDPSEYKTEFNTIDTYLNVRTQEILDDQTVMKYTIRAGQTVTLTFTFSVMWDKTVAFSSFLSALSSSAAMVGDPAIQQAAVRQAFSGHNQVLLG